MQSARAITILQPADFRRTRSTPYWKHWLKHSTKEQQMTATEAIEFLDAQLDASQFSLLQADAIATLLQFVEEACEPDRQEDRPSMHDHNTVVNDLKESETKNEGLRQIIEELKKQLQEVGQELSLRRQQFGAIHLILSR